MTSRLSKLSEFLEGRDGLPKIKVHFTGILGSGMWPLAQLFQAWCDHKSQPIEIQGSDLRVSSTYESGSWRIFAGHQSGYLTEHGKVDLLVHTAAAKADHVELASAREHNIPTCSRGEMLAALSRYFKRTIVCTGTCGKTSTTAMLLHLLKGFYPTAVLGGQWIRSQSADLENSGFQWGSDDLLIVEADESDNTHTLFQPSMGLITTTTPDHIDNYGSEAALSRSFVHFAQNTQNTLIINHDDGMKHLKASATSHKPLVISVGYDEAADVRIVEQAAPQGKQRFRLSASSEAAESLQHFLPVSLELSWTQYISNAAMAYVAYLMSHQHADEKASFQGFAGVRRRLEVIYENPVFTLINDYAHNPEKVKASIRAIRDAYPGDYLEVIFEPHKSSRVYQSQAEFAAAFQGVHHVIVAPLYEPKGADRRQYHAAEFGEEIRRHSGVCVSHLPSYSLTGQLITRQLSPTFRRRVTIVMGAGKSEEALPFLMSHLVESV